VIVIAIDSAKPLLQERGVNWNKFWTFTKTDNFDKEQLTLVYFLLALLFS